MAKKYPYTAYKACLLFALSILLVLPSGVRAQGAGLPEELRRISINDTFVPLFAEVVGTVQSVQGRLVVLHGDSQRAYYAAAGNTLYRNDVLYTLEASRCRLQFVTEEVITMGANSQVRVDEVFDNRQNQEKRSIFSMVKGKAMFYALRLFRYKKVDVEVRTPTAVAGIRGTKFGVEVEKISDKRASADPVYLADASGGLPRGLLAQAGPLGEGYQTTVYGYDGDVQVTATADGSTQTVGPGENLTVGAEGAGDVNPTPPEQSQQFSSETGTPGEEPGQDEGAETGQGEGDGPEEPAVGTAGVENEAEAMDVGQNLTNQDMAGDEGAVVSGSRVGYFTALLTKGTAEGLGDIFNTSTRVNFEADEVSATSIVKSGGSITLSGTQETSNQGYVKRIKTTGFQGNDLGEDFPADVVSSERYTHGTVLKWNTGGEVSQEGDAYVDIPGYMVLGETTPDAAAAGIRGTYSGEAWGTYYDQDSDQINMDGIFSCNIDVPAKKVTGFTMDVAGNGVYAKITGGSGTFKGNSGEFSLNAGTWNLNGNTNLNWKSLVGSLYGPNGESVGGTWAMGRYFDPAAGEQQGGSGIENFGAVGAFFGDKQAPPAPGNRLGYMCALLTERSEEGTSYYYNVADAYLNEDRKDIDTRSYSISIESIHGSNGFINIAESEEGDVYVKQIKSQEAGFDSGYLGTSHEVISNDMTSYPYDAFMEWGYWQMSGWVTGTGSPQYAYAVNDKGYWIDGEVTPNEVAAGVVGTYSGDAWGTYFNGTGGIDMTGYFECDVDVAQKKVSDFNLYVSGGVASASITDGKGTFIGSTGGFTLDGTEGTWRLNGEMAPTEKMLSGSLYGPNGENIGGAWAMYNNFTDAAVGIFAGEKYNP